MPVPQLVFPWIRRFYLKLLASQRPPLGVTNPLLPTGQLPQQIPIQHFGHQQAKLSGDLKQRKLCNSVGDSPVPSSIDSGTDSPLDSSFSPGLDYEDAFRSPLSPNTLRRSLKAAGGSASYGQLPGKRLVEEDCEWVKCWFKPKVPVRIVLGAFLGGLHSCSGLTAAKA